MYKVKKADKTSLKVNTSYEGESIEEKVQRIVNNKEPISDTAPLIYQERKDGIDPSTDIRTDRFEVAVEAMDKVSASKIAKREAKLEGIKGGKADKAENQGDKPKEGGEPTSLEGTK